MLPSTVERHSASWYIVLTDIVMLVAQAARGWPEAYHLSGEKFPLAVDRTVQNVAALNKELIADNK